jgi:uncharacterized protein (DUF885 family)
VTARYFDQNIANMRAGLARGFSVPHAVLDGRAIASIAMVAQVRDPEQSGFYEPFQEDAGIDLWQPNRRDCARPVPKAIRERLIPAYARLLVFFREEYVPKARANARCRAVARRRRLLPPADPRIHHARSRSRTDPPDLVCRKSRASRARWTRSSTR